MSINNATIKELIDNAQKASGQIQQQLQQEIKDLEPKADSPGVLFSFNKENKEKNGFLKRCPKQVKTENLHEGVFWLSKKNRGIIESQIFKTKAKGALRRSDRIKVRQAPIEDRALSAEGVFILFQNDDTNQRDVAYISRDFEAFIPSEIELGQGQFGTASLVQNALTGKWYCLKMSKKGAVQDSELEALAVEGMLRANEKVPGGDTFILISELIHGTSLTVIIREISQDKALHFAKIRALNSNISMTEAAESLRKESFSFEQALALMISLVEAYESLHSKGYVHRDIKPDNIMFDRKQKKFFAIDFGFVKKAGEKARWSGSWRHSSPEAWNRNRSRDVCTEGLDLKDDIYAMGMVAGKILALAIDVQDLYRDYKTLFEKYEKISVNTNGATQKRYAYLEKTCKSMCPNRLEIHTFIEFYLELFPVIFGAKNKQYQIDKKLSAEVIALCRLIYQMTEPLENRPDINAVLKEMRKIRLDHIEKRITHFDPSLDNHYNTALNELYERRSSLSNAPHVLDDLDIFLLSAVGINEKSRPSIDELAEYRAKLDNTLKLKKTLSSEVLEHFLGKENVKRESLNATLNSFEQKNNSDLPQELPCGLAKKRLRNAVMPKEVSCFPVQKRLRSATQGRQRKPLRF